MSMKTKQKAIVTRCDEYKRYQWRWADDGTSQSRKRDRNHAKYRPWSDFTRSGATLFECLTRDEYRHIIVRIEEV